jgi:nitrogenase molybdenum-iron protein alpha/beta subunit
MLYMSSQPIRIGAETLDALRQRSAQSGEPIVRLAQRYIDEGMRLDRHPGVAFREGPAGRRPVVVGGPDVWEVIAAARSAPERGDELIGALTERLGVPAEKILIAIRYYAEYPDEIDRWITMVDEEAEQLEQTLERERRLLE